MHAAKAALPHDVKADSHNGVVNQFSLHLVKSGLVEPEWAAYIGHSHDARIRADYNVAITFAEAAAVSACNRAAAFLDRISLLLGGAVPSE